ncbi:MAG: hypothetical protein HC899_09650 [Leptolyngbyaceae cyanobacterium SM1_4_3]|nr:hypothetical protein [Leptolyngbyaceae cyanobacterium SM1_4_3]
MPSPKSYDGIQGEGRLELDSAIHAIDRYEGVLLVERSSDRPLPSLYWVSSSAPLNLHQVRVWQTPLSVVA